MVKKIDTGLNSFNPNDLKPSAGFKQLTGQDLERNPFSSNVIRSQDQGSTFERSTFTLDYSLGLPQTNSFNNDLDLQIDFSQFENLNDRSQSFLNRASSNNSLNISSNIGGVEGLGTTLNFRSSRGNALLPSQNSFFGTNILDQYDNVTYNFKLMTGDESITLDQATRPKTNSLYTIAQSGVSSKFNIGEVNIDLLIGPNKRTRNTQATNISVEILEPQGISLIDQIIGLGQQLGISNIINAPMILELSFKGYTRNGTPTEVEIGKKYWKMQLIDIATSMDEGGSRYIMQFAESQDFAFHRVSSASIFKEQISIPLDNVGNFFADLGYFLTVQDSVLASSGQQTRNEYEFIVDPQMIEWKIGQSVQEPNTPSMFVEQNNKRSIVIEPGKKIEEVVDAILSTTAEMEERANPASSPGKMDQPQRGQNNSQIALISSEVEFIGFNPQNNEYIRKFKYYISLYDAWRALPDRPEDTNQQQRRQLLFQNSMRRKYSYIFTGENTDVLNLDLDLDNLWRHATSYYTYAMHRSRNNNSNFLVEERVEVDNPDDLRSDVQSRNLQTNLNSRKSGSPLTNGIQGPTLPIEEESQPLSQREQIQQRLESFRNSGVRDTQSLNAALEQLDGLNQVIPFEDASGNSNTAIGSVGEAATGIAGGRFSSQASGRFENVLGSLRLNSPLNIISRGRSSINRSNLIEEQNFQDSNQRIMKFFIKQTDPALDINSVQRNIEETTNFNRSIFGIITNQMYGDTYSDLVQIELGIRGDPYWLGESSHNKIQRIRSFNVEETIESNTANYLVGEQSFLLTFKTPVGISENTGFAQLNEQTTFKGVYNVYAVTNTFSQGSFTQKLTAIRDLNTDATKIE